MKKMPITLIDLQCILGNTILNVTNDDLTEEERAAVLATASNVYAGARNMIHNASTIMRAKEIIADGKVKDASTIKNIVGE